MANRTHNSTVNASVVVEKLPNGINIEIPEAGIFAEKLEKVSKYDANFRNGFEIQIYPDRVVAEEHADGRRTHSVNFTRGKQILPTSGVVIRFK
ncbi:hypothetical protein [Shimazuella alba]|uniref:Uncharacterized protein n=1 Tax=Shimazuella alba TaxID=2690964 RepID=A0A6I4VZU7_9BACL|nr:hypothetical protein [Shimazuella alba]MXQ53592.1 hypothetical protein [Shimazuella alba]